MVCQWAKSSFLYDSCDLMILGVEYDAESADTEAGGKL